MARDFRNLIVSAIAHRTQVLSRAGAGKQPRKAGRRKFRSKFSARETTVRRVYVTPEEGTNDDAADERLVEITIRTGVCAETSGNGKSAKNDVTSGIHGPAPLIEERALWGFDATSKSSDEFCSHRGAA
jgi:hypothetical protein